MVTLLSFVLSASILNILRKTLIASSQRRSGPNTVGPLGLIQPLVDGIKLILKQLVFISPLLSFPPLVLLLITSLNLYYLIYGLNLLFNYALLALSIYTFILSSIYSLCNFSLVSFARIVSQILSYEVIIAFAILLLLFVILTYHFI